MHPENIGRYEILREIGRGGMAVVYLARDPLIDREVAVKVLPRQFTFDPQFRERFQREARVIAALEHPAIVPIYDFGEHDEQPYLVMRYMPGGNLAARLEEGALPLEEARRIISRLAPALDKAHRRGIIHRDLKPGNILFDRDDNPYVCDFGIAKLTEATATFTGSGIIGTPAYMSPEQARGEPDLDGRSDIYALGVILFQMLTGLLPFEADTPMGHVMKHLTEPIPDILEFRADLPEGCQTVIFQALAKRKYVRYETVQDLAKALNAAVRGESVHLIRGASDTLASGMRKDTHMRVGDGELAGEGNVSPNVPQPPAAKSARGGRALRLFLGTVLVLSLGAIAVLFGNESLRQSLISNDGIARALLAATASPSPTITSTRPPSNTPEPAPGLATTSTATATDTPVPSPTATSTITPTPSGPIIGGADKLAFVSAGDIWVVNLDGTDLKQLTFSGGNKLNLNWTPDGQSVTYIIGRCVQSVNIHNEQVHNILCVNWADYLGAFEISPDGTQVALSLSDGFYLFPYDLEALSLIRTQAQLESADRCLRYLQDPTKGIRWSKDGQRLAAVAVTTEQGRQVDIIKVFDISRCGSTPERIDEFPGTRFSIPDYLNSPEIIDFAWDGEVLFALAINKRNDFGDIYTYNMLTNREGVLNPLGTLCCYRGFRWSPDGDYFLFAFHDIRFAEGAQLFYSIYGTLEDTRPQPIPLPEELLAARDENPQPALRPAP